MRYLLDTCAYIDYMVDKDTMNEDILEIIEDYSNELYVSQESLKEILLLYKRKKIWRTRWKSAEEIVTNAYYPGNPIQVLPLGKEHFLTYANLEINEKQEHFDPSDHLIIAHAITNRIPLISSDHKFRFYRRQGLALISY